MAAYPVTSLSQRGTITVPAPMLEIGLGTLDPIGVEPVVFTLGESAHGPCDTNITGASVAIPAWRKRGRQR